LLTEAFEAPQALAINAPWRTTDASILLARGESLRPMAQQIASAQDQDGMVFDLDPAEHRNVACGELAE
jgi:hypothetical protein